MLLDRAASGLQYPGNASCRVLTFPIEDYCTSVRAIYDIRLPFCPIMSHCPITTTLLVSNLVPIPHFHVSLAYFQLSSIHT